MNPTFIKSLRATADADPHTIAKAGAAFLESAPAAADDDPLIGTYDAQGATSGDMADVVQAGWGEVKLGGTVAAGDMLTADANGHAVKIAAGATKRTIGMAMAPGVDGDIIPYLAQPGTASVPAAA